MSALAMAAVSSGLQTASGINQAFQEQAYAQLQTHVMQRQMDEIESRTRMEIAGINQKAEKITAGQEAAFISSGVEMTGTPMDVLSDTLNDAAAAAFIRRREADYDLLGLSMEKHQMKQMASNETLMLKVASATLGGAASFGKAYANSQKGSARGMGDQTPGNGIKDSFGGDTQYSLDYQKME